MLTLARRAVTVTFSTTVSSTSAAAPVVTPTAAHPASKMTRKSIKSMTPPKIHEAANPRLTLTRDVTL